MIGYLVCIILIIIAIFIEAMAQSRVVGTYNKYKEVESSLGVTGAQLAQMLADREGINININRCKGQLTDNYNSATKTLSISEENYNSTSIAALSIVAHEFGHAMQDEKKYIPLKIRQVVIKTSNFISKLLMPVIIIGLLFEFLFFTGGIYIVYAYIGIYSLAVIASLVTLPVEYNASARAKQILYDIGCSESSEVVATNDLLNAAALTYVAALLTSVTFLLRLIYLLFAFRRD